MNKLWLALVVLVLAIVLIGGLIFFIMRSPGRQPGGWRSAFDLYVTKVENELIANQHAVQARSPQNFQAGDFVSFGDGSYFETDVHYDELPIHTQPAPFTATVVAVREERRPLPYPPEELWCVRFQLDIDGGGAFDSHFVFVSRHEDMHSAAWVVHSGETVPFNGMFSNEFAAVLANIGCEISP